MKKLIVATAISGLLGLTQTGFAITSYTPDVDDTEPQAFASPNSLGVGLAYQQSVYAGVSGELKPFPLINFTYDNFFIKGITLGYNTYTSDVVQISLIGRPDFQGYEEDDSSELNGMGDRDASINVGGQVVIRTLPLITTMSALHDISGNTAGNTLGLKFATGVPLMDRRLILSPSVTFTYQDANVVDYYYGVSDAEATSNRAAYSPSYTINTTLGLMTKYKLSENWVATATYMWTRYGNEVSDSSIVDESTASTVMLGVSYIFG
jgi:outer membrane protein